MTKAEARHLARVTAERDRLAAEHERQSAVIRNLIHEAVVLKRALTEIQESINAATSALRERA